MVQSRNPVTHETTNTDQLESETGGKANRTSCRTFRCEVLQYVYEEGEDSTGTDPFGA